MHFYILNYFYEFEIAAGPERGDKGMEDVKFGIFLDF